MSETCDAESIIHRYPRKGLNTVQCCGQPLLTIPHTDMVTMDPGLVTCSLSEDVIAGISEDVLGDHAS